MSIIGLYRKVIPIRMRKWINDIRESIKRRKIYSIYYANSRKKELLAYANVKTAYIIGTTAHNNLGDHAISLAEIEFISSLFTEYKVYEIEDKKVYQYIQALKECIKPEDIIFLHGGGNVGDVYLGHELMRRRVIQTFSDNRVVILPQTFDFRGNTKELNKSISIYNNHKRLLFLLREEYSYKKALEYIDEEKLMLTPDIVLFLKPIFYEDDRDRIMICFRNDGESVLPKTIIDDFIDIAMKKTETVERIDTIADSDYGKEFRIQILNEFWHRLSKAKLVVTDRLHGMVFCYLLDIPCIVLSNYNHKIQGTYNWLSKSPNIKFFDNYEMALEYLKQIDLNVYERGSYIEFSNFYYEASKRIREI